MKLLFVFGTRPEAIKMASIIRAARRSPDLTVRVCVTGQHRELLQQVLEFFGISPEYNLDVMRPDQDLGGVTARILDGMRSVLLAEKPDLLLVQGDTVTAFAAALAAFYERVPIGHVEAGLRTYDLNGPFPEEGMRQMLTRLAAFHFAPTPQNVETLIREGVPPGNVFLTGNPVIDSVLWARDRLRTAKTSPLLNFAGQQTSDRIAAATKLILVTSHRRENFGNGLRNICSALAEIAGGFPEAMIVYPVHPNPNAAEPVHRRLRHFANVILLPPVDYPAFVYLMGRSSIIVSDSGGVQEEAPALGKPVLVTRDATERDEAATSGLISVVGTNRWSIVSSLKVHLTSKIKNPGTAVSPYGDGHAGEKIVETIRAIHKAAQPVAAPLAAAAKGSIVQKKDRLATLVG